ncbi:MAG: hypothetical protein AB1899_03010 [Pseudomonadota bacterium]
MRPRFLLNLLALASVLLVSGARADCNRPATDYERQDCAFKADRDFRRGNTEVDQAARRYQESLKRDAEEEARRRQIEQQQAYEAERRIEQINQDIDEQIRRAQALGKENNPGECVRVADRAQAASGHSPSRKAQALSAAGLCHVLLGEFAQGEAKLRNAVEVVERVEGPSSPWTQKVVRQLATVYKITQRAGEAQTLLAKYGLHQ